MLWKHRGEGNCKMPGPRSWYRSMRTREANSVYVVTVFGVEWCGVWCVGGRCVGGRCVGGGCVWGVGGDVECGRGCRVWEGESVCAERCGLSRTVVDVVNPSVECGVWSVCVWSVGVYVCMMYVYCLLSPTLTCYLFYRSLCVWPSSLDTRLLRFVSASRSLSRFILASSSFHPRSSSHHGSDHTG